MVATIWSTCSSESRSEKSSPRWWWTRRAQRSPTKRSMSPTQRRSAAGLSGTGVVLWRPRPLRVRAVGVVGVLGVVGVGAVGILGIGDRGHHAGARPDRLDLLVGDLRGALLVHRNLHARSGLEHSAADPAGQSGGWRSRVPPSDLRTGRGSRGPLTHYPCRAMPKKADAVSQSHDLVVIEPLTEWTCTGCGGSGSYLLMEDHGPLCLGCADMDHLVFLPAGNAALSRRAKQASGLSAVVVRFSRSRRRYERQGILVEDAALESAEAQCLADEDARSRRRERDRERRAGQDLAFQARLAEEV